MHVFKDVVSVHYTFRGLALSMCVTESEVNKCLKNEPTVRNLGEI